MDEVTRCPIDYEAAKVGDIVPSELISKLTGERPGTTWYAASQAALATEIEAQLWAIGKPFVVRKRRFTLVILGHSEAVAFTRRETRRGVRKLIRNNERMQQIDRSQLGAEDLRSHDRGLVVSGAVVACLAGSPIVRRLASRRNTPGLESWPEAVSGI